MVAGTIRAGEYIESEYAYVKATKKNISNINAGSSVYDEGSQLIAANEVIGKVGYGCVCLTKGKEKIYIKNK